jgi:putative flippase GtrA
LRFLLVGLLNTVFGLSVYTGLILVGLPVPGALGVSLVVGVAFNFVTTGTVVFRLLRIRLLLPFGLSYAVVYLANLGLLRVLEPAVGSPIVAQVVAAGPVALFSYGLLSRLVFVSRASGCRST